MLGIAVCATYATGAMALLDGLEAGTESVLNRLDAGPYLAYRGTFPDLEPFGMQSGIQGPYRAGWLRPAELVFDASTVPVRLLAFSETGDLSFGPSPREGESLFSSPAAQSFGRASDGVLVLRTEEAVLELTVGGSWAAGFRLPDTWILVSEADLRLLASLDDRRYDLLFLAQRADAAGMASEGYAIQSVVSAPDFFAAALQEARGIVGGLVAVSAAVIAVVAYSLLALEIRYRRDEIRTLRALGLDGRGLRRLYGLQLAFIVAGGTAMGIAGGVVAANGLVSFAPFFGLPTTIQPHLSFWGLLLPLAAALVAGLAGGGASLLWHLRRWERAPRN